MHKIILTLFKDNVSMSLKVDKVKVISCYTN